MSRRAVKWERLSALRTPFLLLLAVILAVVGAAHSPWTWTAWIVASVGVLAIAYLTDVGDVEPEQDGDVTATVAQLNPATFNGSRAAVR